MDSVAKRTRHGWDAFYRSKYAEMMEKREREQQSGEANIEYIGSSRNVVDLEKKKNLDVKSGEEDIEYIGSCMHSRNVVEDDDVLVDLGNSSYVGENGVEYIGSYGNSRNVGGEKLDFEKRKNLDVKSGEKDIEYIGSCLNSRNVVDDDGLVDLENSSHVGENGVEYVGSYGNIRNVGGEKLDFEKRKNVDVGEMHVSVEHMDDDDMEKMVDDVEKMMDDDDDDDDMEKMNGDGVNVDLESSDASVDSESSSLSEGEDDDYSDEDYKTVESESSDDSLEKEGDGAKLANVVEDLTKESENEYGSCDEEVTGDGVICIDENEFRSVVNSKKKKSNDDEVVQETSEKTSDELDGKSNKGDEGITIDAKELSSIKNRTRSSKKKESKDEGVVQRKTTNDKLDGKSKKGDEDITIDEKELFSIKNRTRSSKKKESKDEGVVERMSRKTNDKFDGKSKKEDDAISIDEKELFPLENCARSRDKKESKGETNGKMYDDLEKNGIQGAEFELINILLDSINAKKDGKFSVEKNAPTPTHILPIRFRFEDEVEPPPEKSEWEEYIDSLFQELEMGLRQIEMDSSDSCEKENDKLRSPEMDKTPAACCRLGDHLTVLDEQIGIVCKYCHVIIMDIKYVLPDFYVRPWNRRQAWREPDESPGFTMDPFLFLGPDCRAPESQTRAKGTVWDLVPGIEQGMFPHQREGFEFIWRNIAGDIVIDNLKNDASGSRGCIISHAPGTGKTRLTIAFLQTFLTQYPDCCPVIIAPKGMLLNWELEFSKWNFDVPFHNLNKKELSGKENEVAVNIWKRVGAGMSTEATRVLKLYSWTKDGGVLGISYMLFVKLTRESAKNGHLHEKMKEMLLECPGLLVLDEGHTPRNEQSLMWKALTNVSTARRIILSGTPFQNNMLELFNTLSLVNPEFVKQIGCEDHFVRQSWMTLTRSIGKNRDAGLRRLRAMLDPFVHVHRGTILNDHLPGLRHTVVFLHPTECQKAILEEASSKVKNVFRRIRLVSMVSVHPSLKAAIDRRETSRIYGVEHDVDAGVKMKFLLKLVWLADALGERVLIFSQFLDPLTFIMRQIECRLSWREGREVLYMDGQLDEKQRQDSISSFNDSRSEAKVLLASQRACSEGINLVGASRVVLLDTVWNPSMEKQATSRAYRLGQKKVVHVYRLFTSGVEVRQFAQQIKKVQISELIFSGEDGQACKAKNLSSEDKLLEAMLDLEGFNAIFEKVIYQPDESHLIDIFGLEGQN